MVCHLANCETNFEHNLSFITDRQESCRIASTQCAFYYCSVKIWNSLNKNWNQIKDTKVLKKHLNKFGCMIFFCYLTIFCISILMLKNPPEMLNEVCVCICHLCTQLMITSLEFQLVIVKEKLQRAFWEGSWILK